jgi:hypothetical protein
METKKHFKSLSTEFRAVKDRVRNLIGNSHWQSDGEWKESVLRSVLSRHLPANVLPRTGFAANRSGRSKQIDILLCDYQKPTLFQDGDFAVTTPDAVRGIIEVKTKVRSITKLKEALGQLEASASFVRSETGVTGLHNSLFVGLFAYETEISDASHQAVVDLLAERSQGRPNRIVNHLCLGSSLLVRFRPTSPDGEQDYRTWHSYEMNHLAPGYFVSNLVSTVSPASVGMNMHSWFPASGKEVHKTCTSCYSGRITSQSSGKGA